MNLFELNARLAVKLGQSFTSLYDLEWMEYSYLLNIVKKDIEEKSDTLSADSIPQNNAPIKVNLPDHLKLK